MDNLIQIQFDLYNKISRTVGNLKKSGQANITLGTVNARLESIQAAYSKFEKNHEILIENYREALKASDYKKTELAEKTDEVYMTQRGLLQDMADDLASNNSNSSTVTARDEVFNRSGLPKLRLEPFLGLYDDWPSFKDMFWSMVGRHETITHVEKLQYLKGAVKGTALDLIRELATTNDNFSRAWKILCGHYENKRVLVRTFLDKFSTLKCMQSESASELERIKNCMIVTVNSLEGLGRPTRSSEDFFVHSVVTLFDFQTRSKWEDEVSRLTEPPTLEFLQEFVGHRLIALQGTPFVSINKFRNVSMETNASSTNTFRENKRKSSNAFFIKTSGMPNSCGLCKGEHYLMCCDQYKSQSPQERKQIVLSTGSCFNCLGPHKLSSCPSKKGCFTCGERHHSSLHDVYSDRENATNKRKAVNLTFDCRQTADSVQMATVLLKVRDRHGGLHTVRGLIDQGSEVSLGSERLVQRLLLPREGPTTSLYGVGDVRLSESRGTALIEARSCYNNENLLLKALILPQVTSNYRYQLRKLDWPHIRGLQLADPDPSLSYLVEILLGADVYPALMLEGVRKGIDYNQPIAQETIFGWILTGPAVLNQSSSVAHVYRISVTDSLSSLVRSFWEQEELPASPSSMTIDEQTCEDHFVSTHTRNDEGRYIVRLPLRGALPDFTSSRKAAVGSLIRMERRFIVDPALHQLYREFMDAYEDLEHMSRARNLSNKNAFFLPHHGVFRSSSTTTKLRVVFNGSWQSSTIPSLNSHLHVGPNLLPHLPDVILRWRRYQYVLSADIVKMFRQILIHPDDRDFQRVLWRRNKDEKINEYRLNTVTYGLASAPFLAMRTLRQLAVDERKRYPLAAAVLLRDTYMDDILTGADDISKLKLIKTQLIDLCRAGGFPLQKWASNNQEIVNEESDKVSKHFQAESEPGSAEQYHSSLGLRWNPRIDSFTFSVDPMPSDKRITKRVVVSEAARLFDPLGWIAPVIIRAKIHIQTAWMLGVDWDTPLPAEEAHLWNKFRGQLPDLMSVQIPRKLLPTIDHEIQEFQGFSDASERAFAAVLYLRSKRANSAPVLTLIAAKTRVAPLKAVSLPRLELCGALLLARLVNHVQSVLQLSTVPVHLWTDSTITLGWIRSHPSKWKTYVANRVSEIQQLVPSAIWHHVAGTDNPADVASRGMGPRDFINCSLWWKGPEFLRKSHYVPQVQEVVFREELPDAKRIVLTVAPGQVEAEESIISRFSSYNRLIRVTSWCRRWLYSIKRRQTNGQFCCREPFLSVEELESSERAWMRIIQESLYSDERSKLTRGRPLSANSKLIKLTPFLDQDQILRVGGRIRHSLLSHDEKHPIILPQKSYLTFLIVDHFHRLTHHGAVQITLGAVRQRFWIPAGRGVIKKCINQCTTCVRWRAVTATQIMADLPKSRVTPARPFLHVGLDYAGPIALKLSPGRGHRSIKAFIVVFVCMSTRAVHLDVATGYSTDAFLAAFRRFISRRGLCSDVYSDQGTNFQGADAELRRLFQIKSEENQSIREQLANQRVKWHFNPPAAPHHGGLWEAAVKSTKYHIRRVIGEKTLTYEEMITFLTQVEACLNSRPLAALSDDPDDVSALTPGHMLIGCPITALPEPSLIDVPENRLSRWQMVVQMRDHFWNRWRDEYLRGLTPRAKWLRSDSSIRVGSLCLVVSETTAPSRWPLARIVITHPGPDGHVRVCTVKTASTTLKRPVNKLVILPVTPT